MTLNSSRYNVLSCLFLKGLLSFDSVVLLSWSYIAMAASSSLFTCAFQGGIFSFETKTCHKDFVCNLACKRPSYSRSIYLTDSRFFPKEQSSKWLKNERLSGRSKIFCRALEIESTPSLSMGKKFQLDDVIEAQQFDRDTLSAIFEVARDMEKIEKNSRGSQILKGYLMATLFYEPSTRTRLSFESAMKRLGGEVLTTENAREFSSAAKGETLEGNFINFFMLS